MRHVDSSNATHYVRRLLTALLGGPKKWRNTEFVLRKNTTVDYEHRAGAYMGHIRVCGMRRFQHDVDEITKTIARRGIFADLWTRDIAKLQAKERQDAENARTIKAKQRHDATQHSLVETMSPMASKGLYYRSIEYYYNLRIL